VRSTGSPTPVVGCVGLVRDVARIPGRWRVGDRVFVLRGSGPELVRYVWESAAVFSLAHDVSDGGLATALREAAEWSGTAVPQVTDCSLGDLAVVVAVSGGPAPAWGDAVELGTVA